MAIESANVVGYQTSAARNGFNFYTPIFRDVAGTTNSEGYKIMNIQEIQMDSSVAAMGANLQILGSGAQSTAYYMWFDADTAGAMGINDGSKGAWVTEDMTAIEPAVTLEPGQAIQIDTEADKTVTVLAPIEL